MTQRVLVLALAFATVAASPPPTTIRERVLMARELDRLCSWTGLRRLGDPEVTEGSRTADHSHYRARVSLEIDGKPGRFTIEYCGEREEMYFCGLRPDDSVLNLSDNDFRGFQYENDTLKDRRLRGFAVAAVKKLNQHLRWGWASPPMIQKLGRTIVVTYLTVPRQELKKPGVISVDPYLTFFVSPRGTVFAAYFGA